MGLGFLCYPPPLLGPSPVLYDLNPPPTATNTGVEGGVGVHGWLPGCGLRPGVCGGEQTSQPLLGDACPRGHPPPCSWQR